MMKLITYARMRGTRDAKTSLNSLYSTSGKRISRINNVMTMANTPSLNASRRDFSMLRLIIRAKYPEHCHLFIRLTPSPLEVETRGEGNLTNQSAPFADRRLMMTLHFKRARFV